jgi:2'-5' RNA ligase
MAKQRLKSPRARLFVALTLPSDVREGLARWQREALSDERALRPSRPETLHMTLAFLGYHPERDIERIADAATGFEAAAPLVRLVAETVPVPKGRPRLFAIGADSPQAVALQAEVSARLVSGGFYKPEKRPFWPHLTVARVRPERRGSRRPARVARTPDPLPKALLEPFRGVRITLYRSHLRPAGAEYVPMANLELPNDGSGKA